MALVDYDVEFIEGQDALLDGDRLSMLLAISIMDYAIFSGCPGILAPKPICDWHLEVGFWCEVDGIEFSKQ